MFVLHNRVDHNNFFLFYAELYLHTLVKDQIVNRPPKMHAQLSTLLDEY